MMSGIWGYGIVCAVLALAVGMALRSIWKSRRSGGHCTGDCSHCSSCGGHGKRPSQDG